MSNSKGSRANLRDVSKVQSEESKQPDPIQFPEAVKEQIGPLNDQISKMAQTRHNFVIGFLIGAGFNPKVDNVSIDYDNMQYTVISRGSATEEGSKDPE